jgi:hypothetical protein
MAHPTFPFVTQAHLLIPEAVISTGARDSFIVQRGVGETLYFACPYPLSDRRQKLDKHLLQNRGGERGIPPKLA